MKPYLKALLVPLLLAPLALAAPGEKPTGAEKRDTTEGRRAERAERANRAERAPGARLINGIERATADLDLSADQRAAVDAITAALPAKVRELVSQTQEMAPRDRADRLRELLTETRTSIEAVLNDEQKAQLAEKLDAARAQREARQADRNADQQPQPNARRQRGAAGQQGPAAQVIERMESAVGKLDLSAEQKSQVETVMADLKAQLLDIRNNANGDVETARTQAREALTQARRDLVQSLDAGQREQLRSMMQDARGTPEAKPDQDPAPPATAPSSKATPTQPAAPAAGLAVSEGDLTRVGEPAPEITLRDLKGKPTPLRQLVKTRPLVVVNGSYTSPIFRERVRDLRELRRSLGPRADVCVVYVAEAHPAGEWDVERNRDAGISVTAHDTLEARTAAAEKARKQLDIDLPIFVDELSDAYLKSVHTRPNAAVVLRRDGSVAFFQNWFEPHALQRAIDELTS